MAAVVAAPLIVADGFETSVSKFGALPDGSVATLYTIKNEKGLTFEITNYGGIITRLWAPDRDGNMADIALGYDNLEGYLEETPYFGALIGRYGNRIGGSQFAIDGETYQLVPTPGQGGENYPVQLHGGVIGWDKKLWGAQLIESENHVDLVLTLHSPDGDQGFPGAMDVVVTYTINHDNELIINYTATTTKPTHVNLTQHSYFNLAGEGSGTILDHQLQIIGDSVTAVNEYLTPTGYFMPVEGTPFDFNEPTPIGARIDQDHEQLEFGGGYDHNWVLRRHATGLSKAAYAYEPTTGRTLEVWTTEPGIQFYCGNFLDGSIIGKNGEPYVRRSGFCLETQHYPDSPNQPNFPSTALYPGDVYDTTTVFIFGTK